MDSLKFWLDDTDKLFLPDAGMSGVVRGVLPWLAGRARGQYHALHWPQLAFSCAAFPQRP